MAPSALLISQVPSSLLAGPLSVAVLVSVFVSGSFLSSSFLSFPPQAVIRDAANKIIVDDFLKPLLFTKRIEYSPVRF